MRRTVLFALLLGELAAGSHAILLHRESKATRTESARATTEATMEATMESSMGSYTSEAAFRANALLHTSMFGHTTYEFDAMVEQAAESSTVVSGSEKPDDGAEDGDVVGAEDDSDGENHVGDNARKASDTTQHVGTTLSPEQRLLAHQNKYETEFIVELNMTEAHETGQRLGITLDRDADFTPAKVWHVQKYGMVEDWNRAHPDKAVHVGDEVVRVNDIQWHANTETFISRIVGQFQSARSFAPGAQEILSLYVQRPRHRIWEDKAFEGQRWDAHKKEYPVEFIACIKMPDKLDDTMEKIMGWRLSRQHGPEGLQEWKPVLITYVDRHGNVEAWNKEHPDQLILEGDEIIQLDNIRFNHNSTLWQQGIQKHYRSATTVRNTNRSALVYIRRPAQVQAEFDATHPVKEIVTWSRPKHSVDITFPKASDEDLKKLTGWIMLPAMISDRGSLATRITDTEDPGLEVGLVNQINAEHPETINTGDRVVEVNGLRWEEYDSANDFYDVVDEALKEAAKKGPDAEPVKLVLERPIKFKKQIRSNMRRGVHMDAKILKHLREMRTTTTTELPPMPGSVPGSEGTKRTHSKSAYFSHAIDATDKDEVTGASEDDEDSDVVGAGEDEPTGASEDSPSGAKDANEEADDAP